MPGMFQFVNGCQLTIGLKLNIPRIEMVNECIHSNMWLAMSGQIKRKNISMRARVARVNRIRADWKSFMFQRCTMKKPFEYFMRC